MKEAIILAGGLGKRLRDIVPNLPKSMAIVRGRPFLEILLEMLSRKGFTRVVLSLGYKAENVLDHFDRNFAGMDIDFVIENKPLGTGGAIRLAMTKSKQNHTYILNGDTYLDLETELIEAQWAARGNPIIVGRQVQNTERFGRIQVQDGIVSKFIEKGVSGSGLINAGCYVLNHKQLDAYKLFEPFSFEYDYLVHAVNKNIIDVFVSKGQFIDIGVPEDYVRAQHEIL